jgi:molybdopterin molybdotransferase
VITVAQALEIIARETAPGPAEKISIAEGCGRVLAQDVVADVDWPPFETSAMDGYAVRLGDIQVGRPLAERATAVMAGDPPPPPMRGAEAVRIMTGAPLPSGTEAIIPVEESRPENGEVVFRAVPAAGAHIRRRGESVAAGSTLLRRGRRMTPADVALAAMAGADPVSVYPRPSILIAATGNELVAPSERPRPGQLRDSNGPMLFSLCRSRGWPAALAGRVADDSGAVEKLFQSAPGQCRFLVTSGGVSAGELDLLPEVAHKCGYEILFHGVAVQPGKPIAFGKKGDAFWFGLPGNPVSSSVAFHVFVQTALDRIEGFTPPGAPRLTARAGRKLRAAGSREAYRDAVLRTERGTLFVDPVTTRGSHDIAAHARANVLIRIPPGAEFIEEGTVVECLWIADPPGESPPPADSP